MSDIFVTVSHDGKEYTFENSTELEKFVIRYATAELREMTIIEAGDILKASDSVIGALTDWDYYTDLLGENQRDAEIARLWCLDFGASIAEWEHYFWGVYDSYDDFVKEHANENIFYDVQEGYLQYVDYYALGEDLAHATLTIDLPTGTVAIFHY